MSQQKKRLLKNKLYSSFQVSELNKYEDRLIERNIWKGEILENEGNFCESMGFILSGSLSVEKYSSNGNYAMIDLLGPGDSFGEDLMFSEDPYYHFSIEAASDAKILMLPRSLLLEMMNSHPHLHEVFIDYLSKQIFKRDRRILVLSQRNLRQKISAYLISLLNEQGGFDEEDLIRRPDIHSDKTYKVELPVSKEVAARLLAMPRPSFSRELLRMENDGLLKVNGRDIWLLNLFALDNGGSDEDEDE
ncbi:MAG: Crp/Fnr family transcriptional regulator [Eubacteriales bacterium]|nr:Crp/Fnr family transcriptional regulator [Eubacteriales bacterium]